MNELNQVNHLEFEAVNPFKMRINYTEADSLSPLNSYNSHVHPECEIYINLSGNVSFMVENRIYPIFPGNVIISRPYEYHHLIYNSNALHKHFCIQFSCEGNENILDLFFERNKGDKNLIILSDENNKKLIKNCHALVSCDNTFEKHALFFSVLNLLKSGKSVNTPAKGDILPTDVLGAITYINENLSSKLSIKEIATHCHVSLNTLERHFTSAMNMSPTTFIKKKRLAYAAELLSDGKSVLEACEESGFPDCSHFISDFKKYYKLTPLQYKKRL